MTLNSRKIYSPSSIKSNLLTPTPETLASPPFEFPTDCFDCNDELEENANEEGTDDGDTVGIVPPLEDILGE